MGNRQIVIFDVETTGTDKRQDQVIELCVQFGFDDDAESRVWRIRPDVPIRPGAQAVHGISMDDLAKCPRFDAYADEIRAIFDEATTLVGYNLTFDIEMMQAEYQRLGLPLLALDDKRIVDAFRLWQQSEPRSLQDAHRRFVGSEFSAAHSAAADVAATGRVLRGMLDAFGLADRDLDEVAALCEPERGSWLGTSKHLVWSTEQTPTLNFGKHRGAAVHELAAANQGYLRWILVKDFPAHVVDVCRHALDLDTESFLSWVRECYGASSSLPAANGSSASTDHFDRRQA